MLLARMVLCVYKKSLVMRLTYYIINCNQYNEFIQKSSSECENSVFLWLAKHIINMSISNATLSMV